MKVLLVNSTDQIGGAAKAAYRLHQALNAEDVGAILLTQTKTSDDATVLGPQRKLDRAVATSRPTVDSLPLFYYSQKTPTLFSPGWVPFSKIVSEINTSDADIVHLHWVCGGTIRIRDLRKINKPIVWSLHDMWPFTGGCHYDEFCGGFTSGCRDCRVLNQEDCMLSQYLLKQKDYYYKLVGDIKFIPTSNWIKEQAEKSIIAPFLTSVLHNPLDVDFFKPLKKQEVRSYLNIPLDKNVILFGASVDLKDQRKGLTQLVEAIQKIESSWS